MSVKPSRRVAKSKAKNVPAPVVKRRRHSAPSTRPSLQLGKNISQIDKQLVDYAWLQAIGTNLAAIGQTKSLSKRKSIQLEGHRQVIVGNTLQAISNAAQADLLLKKGRSKANELNSLGSLLQAIGESLQVYTDLTYPDS